MLKLFNIILQNDVMWISNFTFYLYNNDIKAFLLLLAHTYAYWRMSTMRIKLIVNSHISYINYA
jgi:hypothetical protein